MIRDAYCARADVRTKGSKLAKLLAAVLASAALSLGLAAAPSVGTQGQALADSYTYTITLYAGNGTLSGPDGTTDSVSVGQLAYGDMTSIVLDNASKDNTATVLLDGVEYTVRPNDDRYYPKGIRLAGQNEQEIAKPAITVTESQQYVIAYGLMQDRVGYTVEYVDANGNALAESKTFYGNVGDKPVAAYQYVEGYIPNALNITGTLSANEADNVFRFVYAPLPAGEDMYEYASNAQALVTGPSVALEEAEAANLDGADAEAVATEPIELIDLDDDETPLASGDAEGAATAASDDGVAMPAWPLGLGLAVVAIALFVLAFAIRRRSE